MDFDPDFGWPSLKNDDLFATLDTIQNINDPSGQILEESLNEADNWASEVLASAKLPSKIKDLQKKFEDIDKGSSSWYAANSLLQSFTLRSALEEGDQATAILLGFLLADFRWQGQFAEHREQFLADEKVVEEILNNVDDAKEVEIQTYTAAITALKEKYPHCTVNALRILLAKNLGVSKDRLDELDITPE
ncbi:MAG: hypothetical protein AAGB35_05135 [Pseudomonadota bacterium]